MMLLGLVGGMWAAAQAAVMNCEVGGCWGVCVSE